MRIAEVAARKLRTRNRQDYPQLGQIAVRVEIWSPIEGSFTVHKVGWQAKYNGKTQLRLLIRDAILNGVFREFIAVNSFNKQHIAL